MVVRLLLVGLLCVPGLVMADAGDGDFMGYRLGDAYKVGPNTQQRVSMNGNLVIDAEQPVKPEVISQVRLVTTRKSMTIGAIIASEWFATEPEARQSGRKFFQLVRAKYPDWAYGWEVMDASMQVIEVSLRNEPYELTLDIAEDPQNPAKPWRFSLTLDWIAMSKPDAQWRAKASSELIRLQEKDQKEILIESDSRGL